MYKRQIVNSAPNIYGNYGFDQANYGLFIDVTGGTKNYGISSNAGRECVYGKTAVPFPSDGNAAAVYIREEGEKRPELSLSLIHI